MDTPALQRVLDEIEAQIAAGNMISAIKLYRDATGVGLAEAKTAVDRIAAGKPPPSGAAPSLPAAAIQEVSALVVAGRKIEAIKLYRSAAGVDLKAAKEGVDALEARINPGAVANRAQAMQWIRRLAVLALVIAAAIVALTYLLSRSA